MLFFLRPLVVLVTSRGIYDPAMTSAWIPPTCKHVVMATLQSTPRPMPFLRLQPGVTLRPMVAGDSVIDANTFIVTFADELPEFPSRGDAHIVCLDGFGHL